MGNHNGRRSSVRTVDRPTGAPLHPVPAPASSSAPPLFAPLPEQSAAVLVAPSTALVDRLFAEPADALHPSVEISADRSATTQSSRPGAPSRVRRPSRHRRLLRIAVPLLSVVVIVAVAFVGVNIARHALRSLKTPDYVGAGTGSIVVEVRSGDGAAQIAAVLHAHDVVESTKAFTDAAAKSGHSQDFQSGWFGLRRHMSGKAAVAALLDPTSRVTRTARVAEGLIEPQVLAILATATHIPLASLVAASKNIKQLGLPSGFTATTAEGFLFPATYKFDPDATASDALQQMTAQFAAQARALHLASAAAALRLTPYQVLTIASMVEAEARFPQDRAKVARVVLNRLARHINLGFDSTTAYGLRIQGKDPRTATYQENSPYNTRLRPGLPPTPIGNPGVAALTAAAHPAPGNWLYFVSDDAAGHLFFTNDPDQFLAASQRCRVMKWGCT